MAQTHSLGGPFNEPRQIRQYEAGFRIQPDHPQHRSQGGEMIGRHFRTGRGHPGHNGGFPYTGIAYHAHVRQHLQFQPEPALGPRFTFFRKGNPLFGAGHIAGIPFAAPAAPGCHELVSRMGQIRQGHPGGIVIDHGPQRHFHLHIGSLGPGAVLGCPVAAPLGHELPLVAEIHQGVQILVRHQDHGAAPAAVASVRASAGHIFFSPETGGSIAARSCFHINPCFIRKQHVTPLPFFFQNLQSINILLYNIRAEMPRGSPGASWISPIFFSFFQKQLDYFS